MEEKALVQYHEDVRRAGGKLPTFLTSALYED
jgi:hypothetical protein